MSNFENGTKIEDHVNTMLDSCPNFGGSLCKKKETKREEKHWKEVLKLHLLHSPSVSFTIFWPKISAFSIWHFCRVRPLFWPWEKKKKANNNSWLKISIVFSGFLTIRFSYPLPQKTISSFCCLFITLTGVDSTVSPRGILALLGEYILWFDCSKQISEIPDTSEQESLAQLLRTHRS